MLAIRMQRTGRKGHAQFRVVVQDSRQTPTSGRVVANLGSYNPHTKQATLDLEKAGLYVKNGAQPSERVAKLLITEGVKLPSWVQTTDTKKQKTTKNAEKLRKNQPAAEVVAEEVAEEIIEEAGVEAVAEDIAEEVVASEEPEAEAAETAEPEAEVATEEPKA